MRRKRDEDANLHNLSVHALRKRAAELKIAGRSHMNRTALIRALERRGERPPRGGEARLYTNCAPPAEPTAPPYLDRGRPIPDTYGDDRLCLMIQDARRGYAYWELSGPVTEHFRRAYGEIFPAGAAWHLRVCALRSRAEFDIPVRHSSYHWYIDLEPGELYQVHLGFLDEDDSFVPVLTSTPKMTPVETVSSIFDENWPVGSGELMAMSDSAKDVREGGAFSAWPARFLEIAEHSRPKVEE